MQFYRFFQEDLFLSEKVSAGEVKSNNKVAAMEEEGGYYVNEVDGLPNEHPTLPSAYNTEPNNSDVNPDDSFDDLPMSLIVTNIHSTVFVDEDLKAEMEALFRQFSEDVTFQWLKSFRRLRVNYIDAISAGELMSRPFEISN